MQVTAIDSFSRHASSILITLYQKKISPHKGFSCAHRVLHGGESCSQYIKRTILEQGWGRAIPLIRSRFQACKAANQSLRARVHRWQAKQLAILGDDSPEDVEPDFTPDVPGETPEPTKGDRRPGRSGGGSFFRRQAAAVPGQEPSNGGCPGNTCSDCGDGLDCANPACDAIDCAGADCNSFDCSGMDCSGMDCSGMDCSGMDCSGMDCSGMDCDFGSCN